MSASSVPLPPNDNVAHALAGAGGGILSMALTYPLITLSTRAQVESRRASSAFLAAVQNIIAREGISGLYAGLNSALFGISVTNFVYYYWYEWTKALLEQAAAAKGRSGRKLTTVESMIAGALAGSATVIITNPIWVINTRMTTRRSVQNVNRAALAQEEEEGSQQEKKNTAEYMEEKRQAGEVEEIRVNEGSEDEEKGSTPVEKQPLPTPSASMTLPDRQKKPPGTIGTLLALLRHEGPQALFAGVIPALVLVINPILQYTLFEQLKNAVEQRRKVTPAIAFLLGALGKLFATAVTYPYITVKSQMHVAGSGKKEGMIAALRRMVKEEGYAGLYKGLGPKVTQSVLTAALLFAFKDVLYEQTVRLRMAAAKKRIS